MPPPPPQQVPAVPTSPGGTSLYVGELDPTVTEAMLYEIFSMIGQVASIRVCRDAVTRRSLGYAYVNYVGSGDSERALEQLNYSLIKNKPCRIMWSQRDPSLRKTSAGNIFIKNLDENIDNKALHDTFAAFGNILSCKVAVDDQGQSKGYGFVHYDTAEAAQEAIERVNGMLLNDKVVFVGPHIPKRERQAKIDEIRSRFTNLYIKEIDPEATDEEFRQLFEAFGPVTSAIVQRDEEGKSKGFGFVNFENHEHAKRAVDDLHKKPFKGKELFVTRAQKKSEREEDLRRSYEQQKYEKTLKYQGVNLYIKNMDDDWTKEKLEAEFSKYGTITSTKIMEDDKGNSKGFGFVCFSAPDEATKAVNELNGKMIGTKPLYVSLAQRKDVRKQQLEAQIAQRNQLRNQQLAASGIPGLPYMNPHPMYYGAPAYPPPGGRAMYPELTICVGIGQPGARMPPGPGGRPQYPPPMPYNMPPFPPGAGPAAGRGRGGPGVTGTGPRGGGVNGVGRGAAAARGGYAGKPPGRGANGEPVSPSSGPGATLPPPQQSAIAATLAAANPADHKQILGENLYPKIQEVQPELAGKITGMLLEMDNAELLSLVEDPNALNAKVREAMAVLDEYSRRPAEGQ
ncbi:polyadenylate binding protein [Atractiella rhizophila]|nr:polyadenylate binding protein [Atractiella rhizophila]